MILRDREREREEETSFNSPNRFTCMGFLLLSKGCIPGPHDFASVSGLASHSGCLGPHEFTPVCHSGGLGPHEFTAYTCLPHSSPTLVFHTCLPLWVSWAAWLYTCLPLVSHTCLALWVPWAAWVYTCLPFVSHTCLRLWVPWAEWFYTCLPLVPHTWET